MRNIQLIGILLVVAGSFLPLVHIPIIGNWNYWKLEPSLAIACWFFSGIALLGFFMNKVKLVKILAILLLILFGFTLFAIQFKSMDYFSFLPFKNWTEAAAKIVKLKWGWLLEFSGAILMLFAKKN